MKIKKIKFLLLSSLLTMLLWGFPTSIALADGEGGQVQTNGVITFSEESTTPSPNESSESKAPEQLVEKPKGKLPSTGELVKTSLSISGGVLILLALIFFVVKRKKKGGNEA